MIKSIIFVLIRNIYSLFLPFVTKVRRRKGRRQKAEGKRKESKKSKVLCKEQINRHLLVTRYS